MDNLKALPIKANGFKLTVGMNRIGIDEFEWSVWMFNFDEKICWKHNFESTSFERVSRLADKIYKADRANLMECWMPYDEFFEFNQEGDPITCVGDEDEFPINDEWDGVEPEFEGNEEMSLQEVLNTEWGKQF